MKFFYASFLALTAASTVIGADLGNQTEAQDISEAPACIRDVVSQEIASSGCSANDTVCICKDVAFHEAIEHALATDCSTTEQAEAAAFGAKLCKADGVNIANETSVIVSATSTQASLAGMSTTLAEAYTTSSSMVMGATGAANATMAAGGVNASASYTGTSASVPVPTYESNANKIVGLGLSVILGAAVLLL